MNKALLMVLSGALIGLASSSIAMNQGEMVDSVAADTGLSKTQSFNALDAFEKQLKEEVGAKRGVKLDNFGTYRPREKVGTRTGRTFAGTTTYDNWKLVKKPVIIDEATFNARAAARAGLSVEDFDKATEAYKTRVGSTLRKGGSVAMHGEGTYAVGKVSPRKYYAKDGSISSVRFAKKVVRYKSYGDNKQKFTPDQALSDRLN